ncbi:Phosphatidylserine decarboxylase proenzyme 3 [Tolypocladium ophioglossoides CBS 100239]|uniref:Phosphatidylserine decarboxylase proenzyme 3 n=1 Tax=Tolypocladium ophioglossoides (strain CBS 100239) TaxID=1163406 RepID=A0A0L0NIC2_TOLOC|nr:Phosphatidylserine decarboxylase proenzyme 3 [Tolypocladium ophioglossoides CBS 100239]
MANIVPQPHHFRRIGGWLPQDPKTLLDWVKKLVTEVDHKKKHGFLSWPKEIQHLNNLIEGTSELRMLASAMFDEVPNKPPYDKDPTGNKQIRSYKHMLDVFAHIMENVTPKWTNNPQGQDLIGFPFNAILDWLMATPSGYAFFLKREVNASLKAILDKWKIDVLQTDKSLHVITTDDDGWLSKAALKKIEDDTNITGTKLTFAQLFECDPDKAHWGFRSWDDFFTRTFRNFDTIRPIAYPKDPKWIVSSCESKPWALQTDVKAYDSFWLKGQPYGVAEMMDHHEESSKFVGGTVYQAFLSATSYHRWHSPVTGKVVFSKVIDGTYFSEPTINGFTNPDGPDPAAPDKAQGYITHVATRAMYLIDTESPIGLVCGIYVGMADVSSCEILEKFQVKKGGKAVEVKKGEEIGMFHHGGSTHCLVFEKGLKLKWIKEAYPDVSKTNLAIRSELAYAEV